MKRYTSYLLLVILVLCSIFSILSDVFLTWGNLANILLATSIIGILAIGAAFVIGSAGIDLSVGSLMALTGVLSVIVVQYYALPWFLIFPLCLIIGLSVGAINGYLIGYINIIPLVVTLGMLSIARGLAFIFSDGRPIYGLPEPLLFIGQGSVINIPVPIIIFIIVGACAHITLFHTRFGVHNLAIGSNEKATRKAGILVGRHKLFLYALSGLLAAIAGLLFMARVNAADPSAGVMYELTAISAAIIGGTSLFGGRASIIGAMLGALIMGVLQNGLTLLGISAYYQELALGIVLISAVALAQWNGSKKT